MNDLHGPLTQAYREMCKRAPNGRQPRQIAGLVGKHYTTLVGELGDDASRPHKLGVELQAPLMRACGCTRPLERLCWEMGGVFVPLPGVSASYPEAHRAAVVASARFGALCRSLEDAVNPDGPRGAFITPGELADFEDAAAEAQGKIALFVEAVRERFRLESGMNPADAVAVVRAGKKEA